MTPIKIFDYLIFILVIVLSVLLLVDYGFIQLSDSTTLETVKKISDIVLVILVLFFIIDLFLKYHKSKDWKVFLKKNWFDIIALALIPVFSTVKMLKIMVSLIKKLKILKMFSKIIYKSKKLTK